MGATTSSNSKTVVLGANGVVGNATIEAMMLRDDASNINVTAGIRDEEKFAKKMLTHIPTVYADYDDPKSLKKALMGHDIVFIIVPSSKNRTQHATNALSAAKAVGSIKFVLLLSITLAEAEYTIFGKQFASIEEQTKLCGIPYAIIRLPLLMENIFQYRDAIVATNNKRSSCCFEDPRNPRSKVASVSVDDVGKCSAQILRNPKPHAYQTYNLIGQKYSMIDLTQSMSKVLGRRIKVREIAYRTFKQTFHKNSRMIPEWQVDGLIEWLEHSDDGMDSKFTIDDLQNITEITGERPVTVDHFIACNAPHFGWRIK